MTTGESATQIPDGGVLPVDVNAPDVNRRRERRIYYRSHYDKKGNFIGWFPTLPLPSDPWHMNYYVNKKGFKLWPPGDEPRAEAPKVGDLEPSQPDAITCPVEGCNKVLKSYLGLARHMTKIHKLK